MGSKQQYSPVINKILKAERSKYPLSNLPFDCNTDDIINLVVRQLKDDYGAEAQQVYYKNEETITLQILPATALQRFTTHGRQTYLFDDDLSNLLSEQGRETALERYALEHLPVDTFFVERKWHDSVGFVFTYIASNDSVLITDFTRRGKSKGFIKRSIYLEAERLIKTLDLSGNIHVNGIIDKKDDVVELIFNAMQYIIYLTAINAEIEPVTKQAITKKLTAPAISEYSNKTQSKTQISTVGYRFGNEYRRHKRNSAEQSSSATHSGGGKGVKKTPHIRRSHFHSFWTGKKDSPDDRKLVVKWLQSVFVGSSEYDSDNSDTTVHKVK